ncbi:MAG TPA: nucleoside triphosphate pyrophosphohydrolase [Bacillota bacterium]|nr:nucleoside triphosphate pyrophosphohydrolase [Bacillota bacterium]
MEKGDLQPLLQIMLRLRGENGCPWDREQTHDTLRPYAIEEAYEVAEAVQNRNISDLVDELGDLLLQVVFHATIGKEEGTFDIDDVIQAICSKMERRHPHVFGDLHVENSAEVLINWEAIKKLERKNKPQTTALDGIPKDLPALMASGKLQNKAAKAGFDWRDIDDVWAKITEETMEVKQAVTQNDKAAVTEEVGDFLFAAVKMARFLDVEPETALLQANLKFSRRFQQMEQLARAQGKAFTSLTLAEQEDLWRQVKAAEKGEPDAAR